LFDAFIYKTMESYMHHPSMERVPLSKKGEMKMNVKKLALATTCALALASWATPRLTAQAVTPPPQQDPGQQGEFDGDHQDTGATAIDGKEGPEVGETPEGKEVLEGTVTREASEPASAKELASISPDTDRVQDSRMDSIPD
jgi:hypothetical protein